jgi:hypothetical protein
MEKLIKQLCFFVVTFSALGQEFNYDESKIGAYTLPSILQSTSGKPIKNISDWESSRRLEILELFKENIYGKMPKKPTDFHFEVTNLNTNALNGKAIKKEITLHFS